MLTDCLSGSWEIISVSKNVGWNSSPYPEQTCLQIKQECCNKSSTFLLIISHRECTCMPACFFTLKLPKF